MTIEEGDCITTLCLMDDDDDAAAAAANELIADVAFSTATSAVRISYIG